MTAQHQHARMTIDMPLDEHKKLKALAALRGVSMKDLVLVCLREGVLSENTPNEETLKAFKETDARKGLVQCKDFDDMVNKLDLKKC